jgi:hypothetical protein
MSLDIKKFKKILQKFDISIIEYYSIDGKCAMIKAFIDSICEFLLIYIPSKIRFSLDAQNIYEIVEIDEHSENDDYSKSSKVPNMSKINNIDEEKSVSKYEELTRKYKTNISLDGSDEPIPRKIKRQLNRLKIPFSSLDYDIGVSNGKYIGLSFGDSESIFQIKKYKNNGDRNIMYLINVDSLVKKIDDINEQIECIKSQFYDIIQNVSISNFNSITISDSNNKVKYESYFSGIALKKNEYKSSIEEYQNLYKQIKKKQESIINEYQKVSKIEDPIQAKSMVTKYQKELDQIFYTKTDIIKKGIILISKYQKNLLSLEEVSFDNSIMIDRVNKNFEQLRELL